MIIAILALSYYTMSETYYVSDDTSVIIYETKHSFCIEQGLTRNYFHFDRAHLTSELNRLDNETLQGAAITTSLFMNGMMKGLEFAKGIVVDWVENSLRPSIFVYHDKQLYSQNTFGCSAYACLAKWLDAEMTLIREKKYKARMDLIRAAKAVVESTESAPRTTLPVTVIGPPIASPITSVAPPATPTIQQRRSTRIAEKKNV